MLYNKKWEVNLVVNQLINFIAWLEQQPADKRYSVGNARTCLMGQYGIVEAFLSRDYEWAAEIAFPEPYTFGAALKRARTALAKQRKKQPQHIAWLQNKSLVNLRD